MIASCGVICKEEGKAERRRQPAEVKREISLSDKERNEGAEWRRSEVEMSS